MDFLENTSFATFSKAVTKILKSDFCIQCVLCTVLFSEYKRNANNFRLIEHLIFFQNHGTAAQANQFLSLSTTRLLQAPIQGKSAPPLELLLPCSIRWNSPGTITARCFFIAFALFSNFLCDLYSPQPTHSVLSRTGS